MPPEIWVIMGHGATGKSSTIRALTGVRDVRSTDVQKVHGTLNNIYVEPRSLQEKGISQSDFTVDHNNDTYILCSLRINSRAQYPNGLTYIQEFIKNNWRIRGITVLGTLPYALPPNVLTPLYIPTSTQARMPPNQIAHRIRSVWNWL